MRVMEHQPFCVDKIYDFLYKYIEYSARSCKEIVWDYCCIKIIKRRDVTHAAEGIL